jgi:hypothetical protein
MYGILQCTSKSRVLGTGIPFIQYGTHTIYTIHSKKHKETNIDQWAKVDETSLQLMEILGPVGSYDIESVVLRHIYDIRCTYPSYKVYPSTPLQPIYHAFTVDNESTLDRDDALSIDHTKEGYTIGIHITDITKRLSPEWLSWTELRGSSAYWETGTKPMLPPQLAHTELSLTKKNTYPCISVLLEYSHDCKLIQRTINTHATVFITDNLTYEQFHSTPLQQITGLTDPHDIIAWCMVQYNLYITLNYPNVLLRVQETVNEPASYSYHGTHASFDHQMYCHATSPIRRFSDMYNQFIIQGRITTQIDINLLNERMKQVQQFHYKETVMRLAYQCKHTSMIVEGKVICNEHGTSIQLILNENKKRVWIPFHDSYYVEEICKQLYGKDNVRLELIGIHKNGIATLRVRLL